MRYVAVILAIAFPALSHAQDVANEHQLRFTDTSPWMLYSLIVCLAIFVYLQFLYRKDLVDVFSAFWNSNLASQLEREQELTMGVPALLLNLNFFLVAAHYLFILSALNGLGGPFADYTLLLVILGGLTVIYVSRYLSLKILAMVFPFSTSLNSYNFNIFLFNKVLGVVFLPVIILLALIPLSMAVYLVWPTLVVYLLILLLRYLRAFTIGSEFFRQYTFHFLLYLCTLELFPVVVLYKAISHWKLI